jgi:hypothetical protein
MTAYGERRRQGHYDPDGTAGPIQTTVSAPDGGTTVQTEWPTDYEGLKLEDLREQARSREIPWYGTKSDIIERLVAADNE